MRLRNKSNAMLKIDVYFAVQISSHQTRVRRAKHGSRADAVAALVMAFAGYTLSKIIDKKVQHLKQKIWSTMPKDSRGGVLVKVLYWKNSGHFRHITVIIVNSGYDPKSLVKIESNKNILFPSAPNSHSGWKLVSYYLWFSFGESSNSSIIDNGTSCILRGPPPKHIHKNPY